LRTQSGSKSLLCEAGTRDFKPALFLYDKAGHKVRSFIGETDMPALERAIHKLL
jgi:hypothetical protein